MTIIFKAKTSEGYIIKQLIELLQNNIKTACFKISTNGISLCMTDNNRKILIDFNLNCDSFSLYKFKGNTRLLGLNMTHFHKMVKPIKKKDSIILFIDNEKPNDLGIKVIPKENNRITISYIKIQEIQNIEIPLPTGYNKPVIVPSQEFQKMIKEMNNIGKTINIFSKDFYIKFYCDAASVYSREVVFGEIEDDDISDNEEITYEDIFDTDQLSRITKISGLNNNMKIYPSEQLPLLFKSDIGSLGQISIFIKSKTQIQNENNYI